MMNAFGVVLIAVGLALVGSAPGWVLAQSAATDESVLRVAPLDPDQAINLAQRRIQRHPHDAGAYHRLGDAYIQKARASGDVTYLDRAEQGLRRSLALSPRHAPAWRRLAFVFSSRHQFSEAAAHAAQAIELDPEDAEAYGVLGDAHLELGRYDEAEKAYQRMIQLDEGLGSYGRLSGLKAIRGDSRGSIADLEAAIRAGQASGAPRESIAWAQWQLGSEHFGLGDLEAAEVTFLAALATYPNYHRALAGLGQIRAAHRRFPEAVELYRKALGVIPLPEYAAALGDIHTRMGRTDEARKDYELVEYIARLNTVNRVLYNRELAYFYADRDVKVADALELARRELEVRQDIYAYDVLAWTLLKNGRPEEARATMEQALKLGTRDAKLFFHAGMIHARLGEKDRARQFLRRALETNPHFHVLHVQVAERILNDFDEP